HLEEGGNGETTGVRPIDDHRRSGLNRPIRQGLRTTISLPKTTNIQSMLATAPLLERAFTPLQRLGSDCRRQSADMAAVWSGVYTAAAAHIIRDGAYRVLTNARYLSNSGQSLGSREEE
ncbi:hypothetical protein FOL47_010346, partial [Perkinsus chesapeaki]